jgi:hypothetical protein
MQHRKLFINSLFPHFKYPLNKKKFQTQVEALNSTPQMEDNQYKHTDLSIQEMREDINKMIFKLTQNKDKEKREVVWCTLCRIKGHHKNECPMFVRYFGAGLSNPLPIGGLGMNFVKHLDMIHIIVQ